MIYLHFLDRELRESIDSKLNYKQMCDIILSSVFMRERLFMAYSHFFETCKYDNDLTNLILTLNRLNLIDCITTYSSHKEYIDSRKKLYKHDQSRYPFYFKDFSGDIPRISNQPTDNTTTEILWSKMLIQDIFHNVLSDDEIKKFGDYVIRLKDVAVTKAAFVGFLDSLPEFKRKIVSDKLKIHISMQYTKRYLNSNAHIITGVDDVKYYDILEKDGISYDYNIYKALLDKLHINSSIETITWLMENNLLNAIKDGLARVILDIEQAIISHGDIISAKTIVSYIEKINMKFSERLENINSNLFKIGDFVRHDICKEKNCDYLILCATDEERDSIVKNYEHIISLEDSYLILKDGITMVLVQVGVGMVNAAIFASKAIIRFAPRFIVMVGFCAGSEGDVKLGDIIIANKIYNYSTGKQISPTSILNEQEVCEMSNEISKRVSMKISDFSFSPKIELPKDFDLQVWEFLCETKTNKVVFDDNTFKKYPNLKEVLEFLSIQKYININKKYSITKAGEEYLRQLQIAYPKGMEQYKPSIKIGVMACGCFVQQHEEIFTTLKEKERKTIALDMESFSIAKIAEVYKLPYIIIKGVGDFANNHKSFANRFIPYATFNSFAIALQIIDLLNFV